MGYRALERAAKQHEVRFDLVCAIAAVESGWNPLHVRFDERDKLAFKPEYFADKMGTTVKTEMILQMNRWGIMGIPGFLARQSGFRDPLHTLCGVERNANLSCMILKRFMKHMELEVYVISAWFYGEVFPDKRIKNPGTVKKVLAKLQDLRRPFLEESPSPIDLS